LKSSEKAKTTLALLGGLERRKTKLSASVRNLNAKLTTLESTSPDWKKRAGRPEGAAGGMADEYDR